ncbi:unnamed protein product [Rhizophagus irregularis]|uniref:HMG box domain-containing protein n=1 Tax=Rhizophagus irregularis TaxID=588596 RepID=A0A2N1MQ37_9GLOM|nr:hypothetical protein RhiirC2_788466 [Rhizophagus irregularis]CAB4391873.1 unnamed protein product [Rhizophagus irregularis]CAB5394792.1 unnamed protein product [Rhizophagus irregularis]
MLYKTTQFSLFWSAVMTKSSNTNKFSNGRQKKNENGYIIFSNIYRKTFAKEIRSKNTMKTTGQFWGSLPNDLKNQFTTYANRKRLLKEIKEGYSPISGKDINFKRENSTLCIIYDDLISHNSTPNILPQPRSLDDDEYDKIFDNFVNYD